MPKQLKDTSKDQRNFLARLKDKGVIFGVAESLEGYYNFMGGLRTGSAAASTFDANVSLDMNQLLRTPGGKVYADFEARSFQNPTDLMVGDLQVFDKNTSDPFLQIFEFWYEQKFLHNTLRLKIGKVDANAEFSLIDNGLDFMTSSAHVTPTLFVFSTFPDPAPSVNFFYTPGKLFYASIAAYDANQNDHFLDFSGNPSSVQPSLTGTLWICETGLTWSHLSGSGDDGNLRLGVWKHSGQFNRTEDNSSIHGADGLYIVINQTLWKPDSDKDTDRGLRMFLEFANSNKGVAPIYQHYGGGLLWTGISANRPDDEIGICTQYARISTQPGLLWNHEQAVESFYKFSLASWLNLQPDAQYIIHPGGIYSNALVGTLQLDLLF
ncbi:MAG: carbohydrate porin [Ginsengibacter sp.]